LRLGGHLLVTAEADALERRTGRRGTRVERWNPSAPWLLRSISKAGAGHLGPAAGPMTRLLSSGVREFLLPGLLLVSLDHLAFVCGECGKNLPFLGLGHVEVLKRSPKLSRDSSKIAGEIFSARWASSKPR
jgi:hypothetical protein